MSLQLDAQAFAGLGLKSISNVTYVLQPPLVGNEAPDFLAQAVFDQEFVEVSLSQYRVSIRVFDNSFTCQQNSDAVDTAVQGKYVVLFFYPLDFTFVCPTEITAFSDRHGDFEKLNAEVCEVAQMLLPPCIQLLGPCPNFRKINGAARLSLTP